MPTNVSPEYKKAEAEYQKASEPRDRLQHLKEMLRTIPKHKGTERSRRTSSRRSNRSPTSWRVRRRAAPERDPCSPSGGKGRRRSPSSVPRTRANRACTRDLTGIPRGGRALSLHHPRALARDAALRRRSLPADRPSAGFAGLRGALVLERVAARRRGHARGGSGRSRVSGSRGGDSRPAGGAAGDSRRALALSDGGIARIVSGQRPAVEADRGQRRGRVRPRGLR